MIYSLTLSECPMFGFTESEHLPSHAGPARLGCQVPVGRQDDGSSIFVLVLSVCGLSLAPAGSTNIGVPSP
jgi:hypothetical protein